MKVLVVDDDRAVRDVAGRILAARGHSIEEAESGERALALGVEKFDIVLTDIDMPGMNGNELTRRVRQAGSTDVVILTAHPEIESVIQALRDGAYDYLCKPFSGEGLIRAIERCAQKRLLSRELAMEKALRSELDAAYHALRRMEKVRDLFGQFATPEVALRAMEHPDEFWQRGETREVTILFADVRRFTPFAERAAPQDVVRALNQIFERVITAVGRNGGILNKFMGDGMMALFGAPVAIERHAAAAARAALEAVEAVEALARERTARGEHALRLGVGLNTGHVVAGCLGNRDRTEYSVIGHAVNLAARLEEQAPAGVVLAGPETAKQLTGFSLKPDLRLDLAGISEPVQSYRLEAAPIGS